MTKSTRRLLLVTVLALLLVATLAVCACQQDDGWGTVFNYQTAYAEAQELGYAGSLQDFIASITGKDGTDGKDGVGIKSVTVNSESHLIVTLSNDIIVDCGSIKGDKGDTGENGTDGVTPQLKVGEDNFWYVSYDNGTTWVCLNVKATGADGSQGEQGIQGETGATGEQGPQGEKGETGAQGEKGDKGDQGEQGVSIVSTAFDENGNTVITYSDGTTQTLAHTWHEFEVVQKADCTKGGCSICYCADCGLMRLVNFEKTDHNYVETIVDPTCVEQGYTLHCCSVCGDTYKGNYVNSKGKHNYSNDYVCVDCGAINPDAPKNKTYRLATDSLPTNWNSHTYQSNDASLVLNYATDTLYSFDYNQDKTGFAILPAMAKSLPVDVSSVYAQQFGYSASEVGKAYRITLKNNLKFDNGDVINANTFVESMKLLLNSAATNVRADTVFGKDVKLKIVGAENYFRQGTTTGEDVTGGLGVGFDGQDYTWENLPEYVASTLFFFAEDCYVGQYIAEFYAGSGMSFLMSALLCENATEDDIKALEGKSLAEINADETLKATLDELIAGWCSEVDEEFCFFCTKKLWAEYSWDNVGFFAEDDENLVIVLNDAVENDFYLLQALCTNFGLVHPVTYEACSSMQNDVYVNTYGTSVDTFVGFGPYKLTKYSADSVLEFEKNPYWYGHSEQNAFDDTIYEATGIVIKQVVDQDARLEMFLKGETDSYNLIGSDIKNNPGYFFGKYTYFQEGVSTWYILFNPDHDNLKSKQESATPVNSGNKVIKTILDVQEFRQALSYSLDRTAFISAVSSADVVAKALLSGAFIADPDSGLAYRETNEAKDVILNFWGLTDQWGEGKKYATCDDAIASITGYDPTGAKALFDVAYDKAVASGLFTEAGIDPENDNWELQICIGIISKSGTFYTEGAQYLKTNWTNAVKGTKFEGHIAFIESQELGASSYGDYLRDGDVDLLFGVGYTGSKFDPYSLMTSLLYYGFTDMTKIDLDIEINGQTLRASVSDWIEKCLQGEKITAKVIGVDGNPNGSTVQISAGSDADVSLRIKVVAACEGKIMSLCNFIPWMTDASASMRSMRIQYETENWVLGIGYGGLKYYDFTMTDLEWEAYVASQDGSLNYLD